jgi:hypothetical protein
MHTRARRYGVDERALRRVLQHQCLPETVEVPGQDSVQSFAEAPAWFRRQQQLRQLQGQGQAQGQGQGGAA